MGPDNRHLDHGLNGNVLSKNPPFFPDDRERSVPSEMESGSERHGDPSFDRPAEDGDRFSPNDCHLGENDFSQNLRKGNGERRE